MCFLSSVYLHICGYKIMQRFKTSRNDSCACMRPCGLSVACDSPPAVRRGPPWINWIMILSHSYVDSYYTCLNLSAKFPMLNFVCRCRRSLPNNSMKIRICFLFIFRRPLSNNVEGLICKRLTTLFLLTQKKITYQNIIIRHFECFCNIYRILDYLKLESVWEKKTFKYFLYYSFDAQTVEIWYCTCVHLNRYGKVLNYSSSCSKLLRPLNL